MGELAETIKQYGMVGVLAICMCAVIWLTSIIVKLVREGSNERKEVTERYEHFLENHIHENTQMMCTLTQSIKDFSKDNCNDHKLMFEKLNKS